jgi:REP element-mobilizing transposase RayT
MHSRTRGYLPHIVKHEGIYFVTFRLADSLPAEILSHWKQELVWKKGAAENPRIKDLIYQYQERVQKYLDQSYGNCWLNRPEVASIVDKTIRYFNNVRYQLLVWTIMPNHVHVLLQVLGTFTLSSILHSWKSYSARESNRLLGRTGDFWQREYFDRLITSQRQLEFTIRYILNNPVKAGFCKEVFQWSWTGYSDEVQFLARKFFV